MKKWIKPITIYDEPINEDELDKDNKDIDSQINYYLSDKDNSNDYHETD